MERGKNPLRPPASLSRRSLAVSGFGRPCVRGTPPRCVPFAPRRFGGCRACGGSFFVWWCSLCLSFSFVVRSVWLRCLVGLGGVLVVRRCVLRAVRVFVRLCVVCGFLRGVCVLLWFRCVAFCVGGVCLRCGGRRCAFLAGLWLLFRLGVRGLRPVLVLRLCLFCVCCSVCVLCVRARRCVSLFGLACVVLFRGGRWLFVRSVFPRCLLVRAGVLVACVVAGVCGLGCCGVRLWAALLLRCGFRALCLLVLRLLWLSGGLVAAAAAGGGLLLRLLRLCFRRSVLVRRCGCRLLRLFRRCVRAFVLCRWRCVCFGGLFGLLSCGRCGRLCRLLVVRLWAFLVRCWRRSFGRVLVRLVGGFRRCVRFRGVFVVRFVVLLLVRFFRLVRVRLRFRLLRCLGRFRRAFRLLRLWRLCGLLFVVSVGLRLVRLVRFRVLRRCGLRWLLLRRRRCVCLGVEAFRGASASRFFFAPSFPPTHPKKVSNRT